MRRLALVLPVLVAVTACGSGPEPAPSSLTAALGRVDRLVAAHQYAEARLALDDLVRRTAAARDSGAVDDERAERITAAAARLSAALPAVVRTTPTPRPTAEPAPKRDEKKGEGKKGHDEDKDD